MTAIRDLKRRLGLIKNIENYIKTLQIISATRLKKAEPVARQAEIFLHELTSVLFNLFLSSPEEKHPLIVKKKEIKNTALIVVSSDRGHCGGYNYTILAKAEEWRKQHASLGQQLILIGSKAIAYYRRKNVKALFTEHGKMIRGSTEEIQTLASQCIDWYLSGVLDEIWIVYVEKYGISDKKVNLQKFLEIPLKEQHNFVPSSAAIFEPSPRQMAKHLLPYYCFHFIKTILDSAYAAELHARNIALQTAAKNAEDLSYTVELQLNKTRQANITTEAIELSTHGQSYASANGR